MKRNQKSKTGDILPNTRSSSGSYSLLSVISAALAHPIVLSILIAQSEYNRLKSLGKPTVVHFQEDYDGRKILFFALYQKGSLRRDTRKMLTAAKDAGHYVLAVNTLRLRDPMTVREFADCYIERPNYGRDFGSFKHGFLHIFRNNWHEICPRLMMLNDSVFISDARAPRFLSDMMSSETEVLGSTENYEISHHLGSFCIALAGEILRDRRFQRYWRSYRLTDVRPAVIKRGEMGLSKLLLRCASSPDQFRALYDSSRYARLLQDASDQELDTIFTLTRRCDLTPARRFAPVEEMETIENELTRDALESKEISIESLPMEELLRTRTLIDSFSGLRDAVAEQLRHGDNRGLLRLREAIEAGLLDNFRQHSQIHQNAALLLMMGLPLVKLDGVYRGMWNMSDVRKILQQLTPEEGNQLEQMLLSRPFGGDVLIGWRRAAFIRGLV